MKLFEWKKPFESKDFARKKRFFIEAVENADVCDISTVFDAESSDALSLSLKETNLFLLGEVHGVRENPDVIYTLFKRFGFRKLGLEWGTALAKMSDKFLKSGKIDFDLAQNSSDGRVTAGHFSLLRKLKDEGMLQKVVYFDSGIDRGGWDARDVRMAREIVRNVSDVPMLAVAGNLHTRTEPFAFEIGGSLHHPMGEGVKRIIPDVLSGDIAYRFGAYHNNGRKEFHAAPGGEGINGAVFRRLPGGMYVYELPEAHEAVVPNPL